MTIYVFVSIEAPSQHLGIESPPDDYMPLLDDDLPEDARGPAFGRYVASFFDHDADALASQDVSRFNHRTPSSRTPTIDQITQEELLSITDFLPGPKCETIISEPPYYEVHRASVQKAFFDSDSSMNKWGVKNVWHIYSEKCSWNVYLAAWVLEEKDKANKKTKFRPIEGADHFLMWEDSELAIAVLRECMDS